MRQILRWLLVFLGVGVGIAVAASAVVILRTGNPGRELSLSLIIIAYAGLGILFGLFFFLLSGRMSDAILNAGASIYSRFEQMPIEQLLCSVLSMILGMCVAALLTPTLQFMGPSVFTVSFSAILCVILGVFGYMVGRSRYEDYLRLLRRLRHGGHHFSSRKMKRASRKAMKADPSPHLLDTSALMDGRVLDLFRNGFLSGLAVVPDFVVLELQHVSDSSDAAKRAKGRRGLDLLDRMEKDPAIQTRILETRLTDGDVDMRLLALSRDMDAPVVTCDYNLARAGTLSGLRVLNLNALAALMRPTVNAGDSLQVLVIREGRETGQGIGYTEDGTMIVIDGGQEHVGQEVRVTVTSSLQTHAGRMVFARLEAA